MNRLARGLTLFGALALVGCAEQPQPQPQRVTLCPPLPVTQTSADWGKTQTFDAVGRLVAEAGKRVSAPAPVLVTSVTDIGDVDRSYAISRLIGGAVASGLARQGFVVHEARLREDAEIVRRNGEFVLSRTAQAARKQVQAAAIVIGTLAPGVCSVHVALKLLAAADGTILASADYALPLTDELRGLLDRLEVQHIPVGS